jgi:hypothetical protein
MWPSADAARTFASSLARLELRVLFDEVPDLALVSDELRILQPAIFVVGIESLPVSFSPVVREGR